MAPEALKEGLCTGPSDVWAFGVVMWEIWTYACLPYSAHTNQEVMEGIADSLRLEQPSNCPDSVYRLMKEVLRVLSMSLFVLATLNSGLCSAGSRSPDTVLHSSHSKLTSVTSPSDCWTHRTTLTFAAVHTSLPSPPRKQAIRCR
jgi:hypothetical protein